MSATRAQTVAPFAAEVPVIGVLDRTDVPEGPHTDVATGGGVYEAGGPREGHQICWRAYGAVLELSETTTLPGVQLRGADLWLRFGAALVPSVGLAQLGDDGSLLLSVATRCAEGGAYVYQLRFALPAEAQRTAGAVTTRDSWFAAVVSDPERFLYVSTTVPVAGSLGQANVVDFDATCEAHAGATGRDYSQLVLLASDGGAAVVQLRNEGMQALVASSETLLNESGRLGALGGYIGVNRVLGAIGVGGRSAAPPTVGARLLRPAAGGALLALTLGEDAQLRVWSIGGAAAPAMAQLLHSFPPPGAGAGAATRPALAVWSQPGGAAFLVHGAGGCCVHLGEAEAPATMSTVALGEPAPARAAGCPLLGLAVLPGAAGALVAWLCYGGAAPTLWQCALGGPGGAVGSWEAAALEAEEEARLAADDGLPREAPPLGDRLAQPVASAMSHLLGRMAMPSRFAPRHRSAAAARLLPAAAEGAPPPPLQAAVQRRLLELEAQEAALAAAQGREPASRAELEHKLGAALLAACSNARAAPAELLALAPLAAVGGGGACCLALLSRSGLALLQRGGAPPPPAARGAPHKAWRALLRAAASVAHDGLARVGVRESEWSAAVCAEADGAGPVARVTAVGAQLAAMYDNAAGTGAGGAAAAAGMPSEWYEPWGGPAAGMPAVEEVVSMAAGAVGELVEAEAWAAQWHATLLGGWLLRQGQPASQLDGRVVDTIAAQPAASAAQAAWLAAAAAGTTREAARLCRGLMLLVQLTRPAGEAPAAGVLPAAAAALLAQELLLWLLLTPLAASPAAALGGEGGESAVARLLAGAALPAEELLDGAPYAACLLSYVQCDVRLAEEAAGHAADGGDGAAGGGSPGGSPGGGGGGGMAVDADGGAEPPCSMGLLLATAGLWRPLRGYLRRLGSRARVHSVLEAHALLREMRVEAAAAAFEAAADGASAAQLGALLRAARIAEPRQEAPGEPSEEALREWRLCAYQLAVRRAFRDAGQSDQALHFATLALALPTLAAAAPHQCASLLQETFTLSLQLGRTRQAHATLVALHERGAAERAAEYAAAQRDEGGAAAASRARAELYEARRADCVLALVSQLAARGALQQLGGLDFPGELDGALQEALLRHARTSAVAPPWGAPADAPREVTAYEVAYALRVRAGDYAGGAKAMFELAARLQHAVASEAGARPAAALRRALLAQAAALGACLAALEQLPPAERFLCDAARVRQGPTEAEALKLALDDFELRRGAPDARGLPVARPPSDELVAASLTAGGALDGQRQGVAGVVAEARARLAELQRAEEAEAAAPLPLPVQVYEVRQQRALALARAALLGPDGPPTEVGASLSGAAPAALLTELLRRRAFAAAAPLALAFRAEMEAAAPPAGPPAGLPLLVGELARTCAALDGGAAEVTLLRALLREHDTEALNYELSAAAVAYWLHAAPAAPLPGWLLAHFGAAPPSLAAPAAAAAAAGGGKELPPLVLRVSGAAGGAGGAGAAEARVRAVLAKWPASGAALEVRGVLGCGGAALLSVPRSGDADAQRQAVGLVDELYAIDPGCRPVRRNPAALVRALLRAPDRHAAPLPAARVVEALRQVRLGCEAGLQDARACWVMPKLIDDVHAEVARQQGVAPCSADGQAPGALQPELRACFRAMDTYYDHVVIGLPREQCLPDDPAMRRTIVVDYEEGWPDAKPYYLSAPAEADVAVPVSADELFAQMLETACRWVEHDV